MAHGTGSFNPPPTPAMVEGHAKQVRRQEGAITAAVIFGLLLCILGVILGVSIALHRVERSNATYAHPHAGIGLAIALLAAVLGVVVSLAGFVATTLARERSQRS